MVGPFCDKVCLRLATGRWFSPGPPGSPTNKTDCHDITEILLKVTLNTIKQKPKQNISDLLLYYRLHNCRQSMHIIDKAESVNQKSLKMFYRLTWWKQYFSFEHFCKWIKVESQYKTFVSICIKGFFKHVFKNNICGVMVSVLATSAVYCGFKRRSGQTNNYAIGMCCFSAKHASRM
jgi:hypothetical protein